MIPDTPSVTNNPFACCPRANGQRFQHECECPSVQIIWKTTGWFSRMMGFYPFLSWTGAVTLYKKFTVTQDTNVHITVTPDSLGPPGFPPQQTTRDISAITGSPKDETTPDSTVVTTNGEFNPGEDSSFDTTIGGSFPSRSGQSAAGVSEGDDLDPGVRLLGFRWLAHFVSATLFQLKTTHQIVHGVVLGHDATSEINAVTQSVELVDADTDDDALTRAKAGPPDTVDSGVSSPDDNGQMGDTSVAALNENRDSTGDSDGVTFKTKETNYAVLFGNLRVGRKYKYTFNISRRTAMADAAGDEANYGTVWVPQTPITGVFIADKPQKLIGGTWTDTNSDNIITPDEVTATDVLATDKGYQTAIVAAFCEPIPL